MPSYIIKAEPDVDFYVMWSTIVDAPTRWGPRAELERCRHDPREIAAERFERADANGTSANWPNCPTEEQPYAWGDEAIGLGEVGPSRDDGWYSLPRENLRAFCERLEDDPRGEKTADLLVFELLEDDPTPTANGDAS